MTYNPRRVASPDEDRVPLKRLSLPDYALACPSPYGSPLPYELEKSPFTDTVAQEATVGRRPDPLGRRHTQHRKSWEESWSDAVQVGRWPRILYGGIGVLFVIVWMIVTFAFDRFELQYQTNNAEEERHSVEASATHGMILWTLQGSLKQFDPDKRILTVNWQPMLIDHGNLSPFGTTLDNIWEIGVFRDQKLVPDTDAQLAQINATYPDLRPYAGLRIDNATALPIAVVGRHEWDSFSTDIDFGQMVLGHGWAQPQFGFPLDKWSGNIVFVGQYHFPARKANMSTSFGISIDGAYLVDSILNWRITAETQNSCANLTADSQSCELKINFTARRPGLVIFATLIAVLVNWISTTFIFVMTCEGVILRRSKLIEGAQLLGVCFTALFALPSVRMILPGAPSAFGCLIDLVGIIPNVIIVSLCTTMVAISTLKTMVETHKRRVTTVKYNRLA